MATDTAHKKNVPSIFLLHFLSVKPPPVHINKKLQFSLCFLSNCIYC